MEAPIYNNNNEGHGFNTDMDDLNREENRLNMGEEKAEEDGRVTNT